MFSNDRRSRPVFIGNDANISNKPEILYESHPRLGRTNRRIGHPRARPTTRHFSPFDEDTDALIRTPDWQKDIDNHFTNIFRRFFSSGHSIDDLARPPLQIIGTPTRPKIRSLARAIYMHWVRMQFRSRDPNVSAREMVIVVSRIADRLRQISVPAYQNFLDELCRLCVQKLKLTLRWYIAVLFRAVLPIPRSNMFMRVMAAVAMIAHLFCGGQFRYGAVLDGLNHVAAMFPWPDAIAITYALLHELGPKFALEQAGWHFVQCLLTKLSPLTANRVPSDPICQLDAAIKTLVTGWYMNSFVLYSTAPGIHQRETNRVPVAK